MASSSAWASSSPTAANPVQSVEIGQSSNSDVPSKGPPLPIIVGVVVTSIFLVVAVVVGGVWFRHRRAKAGRQDARMLRDMGTEKPEGEGAWAFETAAIPPPARQVVTVDHLPRRVSRGDANRQSSSTWSDDTEMDMMATDGSTLARTLSTRSTDTTSTIRTMSNQTLDHPGYTYQSAVRSTPSTFLAVRSNTSTLRSPFADTNSSPSTLHTLSPFADTNSSSPTTNMSSPMHNLRPESRISTTSSENPFRDPLPEYTLQERETNILSPMDVPMLGENGGLERQLQRPPPAYVEMDRAARR